MLAAGNRASWLLLQQGTVCGQRLMLCCAVLTSCRHGQCSAGAEHPGAICWQLVVPVDAAEPCSMVLLLPKGRARRAGEYTGLAFPGVDCSFQGASAMYEQVLAAVRAVSARVVAWVLSPPAAGSFLRSPKQQQGILP